MSWSAPGIFRAERTKRRDPVTERLVVIGAGHHGKLGREAGEGCYRWVDGIRSPGT